MKDIQGIELMVGDKVIVVDAGTKEMCIDTIQRIEDNKIYLIDRFHRADPGTIALVPTVEDVEDPSPSPCENCGDTHSLHQNWQPCNCGLQSFTQKHCIIRSD